jgi:hypothetical protein
MSQVKDDAVALGDGAIVHGLFADNSEKVVGLLTGLRNTKRELRRYLSEGGGQRFHE